MAKVPYEHDTAARGSKYPWDKLREVGDYFDAPASAGGGPRNSAYANGALTGRSIRTFRTRSGQTRVMLVELEPEVGHD